MTLDALAPDATDMDAQLDGASLGQRSGNRPSRVLWWLQIAFLALGLAIDFVAFSAALQVLNDQMEPRQAQLIAACGGALALFLMFEAGHLQHSRRTNRQPHGRGLIGVLISAWLLAGLGATFIRVTTQPEDAVKGIFDTGTDSAAWDLGLFTVYPKDLPMALFMLILYIGVGISAYIAGLKFEEHRQPKGWLAPWRERRADAKQRRHAAAEQERLERAQAVEQDRAEQARAAQHDREERAKAAEHERIEQAKAAEQARLEEAQAAELARRDQAHAVELERLKQNLAEEQARLGQLRDERDRLVHRLSDLKGAQHEFAGAPQRLVALNVLEDALVSLEEARAERQLRLDEQLAAQQRAASLGAALDELPGQIDLEKQGAQESGRVAAEHARQVLSRGLGDPAKTVMSIDDVADEDPTDDPRWTR